MGVVSWLATLAAGVGVAVAAYKAGEKASKKTSSPPATGKRERERKNTGFVLAIELEFKTLEDRDKWLALLQPLSDYCDGAEPETLCYQPSIADNNPLKVFMFERYSSKPDHVGVHVPAAPYQAFKQAAADAGIEFASKRGQSYIETDYVGFM